MRNPEGEEVRENSNVKWHVEKTLRGTRLKREPILQSTLAPVNYLCQLHTHGITEK